MLPVEVAAPGTRAEPSPADRPQGRKFVPRTTDKGPVEPVSPELVLVDPQLRRLALELPPGPAPRTAWSSPSPEDAVRAVPEGVASTKRVRRSGRGVVTPFLAGSLLLNLFTTGILLGVGLGERDSAVVAKPTSTAPTEAGQALEARPSPTAPAVLARDARQRRSSARRAAEIVERRMLELARQAPRGELPDVLLDRDTGLLRTNVSVACTPTANASHRCSFFVMGRGPIVDARYRRSRGLERVVWRIVPTG